MKGKRYTQKDIVRAFGLGYNMGQRNHAKFSRIDDVETVLGLSEMYLIDTKKSKSNLSHKNV